MLKTRNILFNKPNERNNFIKLYNDINEFSLKKQNKITINKLLNISKFPKEKRLSLSANYLYNEMPIRLARRIKDLEVLPFDSKNSIAEVRNWYNESFMDFRNYDKNDLDNNESFLKMIETIYNRHSSTFIYMARGIHDFRKTNKLDGINVTALLNRFYSSRIGIRMLLSHYICLNHDPKDNYFGVICLQTNPKKILSDAIEDASYVAMRNGSNVPKFEINSDDNIFFSYVPDHLYYIFVEILKNAIVATNKVNREELVKCFIAMMII